MVLHRVVNFSSSFTSTVLRLLLVNRPIFRRPFCKYLDTSLFASLNRHTSCSFCNVFRGSWNKHPFYLPRRIPQTSHSWLVLLSIIISRIISVKLSGRTSVQESWVCSLSNYFRLHSRAITRSIIEGILRQRFQHGQTFLLWTLV